MFTLAKRTAAGELGRVLAQATEIARSVEAVQLVVRSQDGTDEVLELGDVLLSPDEGRIYRRPSERLLSFNSRLPNSGRCLGCEGHGHADAIQRDRLLLRGHPIAKGGINIPFDVGSGRYRYLVTLAEELRGLLQWRKLPLSSSWDDLDEVTRAQVLDGSAGEVVQPLYEDGRPRGRAKPFRGLLALLEDQLGGKSSAAKALAFVRDRGPCPACGGTRLSPAARAVHFADRAYPEILAMPLAQLESWLHVAAVGDMTGHDASVLASLSALSGGCTRLGLGHLSLERSVTTLSGGEGQRLRMAAAVSSQMSHVCYALDEPSRGLHVSDAEQLLGILRQMVSPDATVLVADHNRAIVAGSDHVVELGPGGGAAGGTVVYAGPSRGAPFLRGSGPSTPRAPRRPSGKIVVSGISRRTLCNQRVTLPLGVIASITGVSGSGKSTLVRDVLVDALTAFVETGATTGPYHRSLVASGTRLGRILYVSQIAPFNQPRSTVLTKLDLGVALRGWFFDGSGAGDLGLAPESLNPNSPAGRCGACDGLGRASSERGAESVCPACGGSRLAAPALWAKLHGRTIAAWLESSLEELLSAPGLPHRVHDAAALCAQLGLGHLSLGRALPTLSGGEAQRLRVAEALLEGRSRGTMGTHTLFIMDEPGAGLHPVDVARLKTAFDAIVADGANTLLLVEHNLDLVRHSDWVIDLGPGAADAGGRVLWCGTVPAMLQADLPHSRTRAALLGEAGIGAALTTRALRQGGAPPRAAPREAVARFRAALAVSGGVSDPDELATHARPAYVVSASQGQVHGQHGVLSLLGVALPLYRIFATASEIPGQTLRAEDSLTKAALAWASRRSSILVGWHPLCARAQDGIVTEEDLREVLRSDEGTRAHAWFDGRAVCSKRVPRRESLDLHRVRFLLDPALTTETAVARAMTLGQGWFSLLDPTSGDIEDFTARALLWPRLRVGQRPGTQQVFDSLVEETACSLCRGRGSRSAIDEALVIRDERRRLDEDSLLTKDALSVLRSSRRKNMMPALARLLRTGAIDLSGPLGKMTAEQREAFWFGYPDRRFLRPDGKPENRGDWLRFRGLYKEVIDAMWKGPDRNWAGRVEASKHEVACPRCSGSGLGWEGAVRAIAGVTMKNVKLDFDLAQLRSWLSGLTLPTAAKPDLVLALSRLDAALKFAVGSIRCGATLAELSQLNRLRLTALAAIQHELKGALAVVELTEGIRRQDAQGLATSLQAASRMDWVFEA
jgi:excinuclease ABC subunit A